MSGELLEALGRAIDHGGLPEPDAIVWTDFGAVRITVPTATLPAWARYFDTRPARVTGRDAATGAVDRRVVLAHLVGVLLHIEEASPTGAG